jgi:hypothetical protein
VAQSPRSTGATGPTGPLTADELEQRRRADGTFEEPGIVDEVPDEPLSPDQIEQRQIVEDDEDDRRS